MYAIEGIRRRRRRRQQDKGTMLENGVEDLQCGAPIGCVTSRHSSFFCTMKSVLAIVSTIYLLTSSVLAFAPVTTTHRAIVSTPTSSSSQSRGFPSPFSTSIISPSDSITGGAAATTTTTSLSVFGKRKTEAQKAEEEAKAALYWAGEWVCKDCGYIYNR